MSTRWAVVTFALSDDTFRNHTEDRVYNELLPCSSKMMHKVKVSPDNMMSNAQKTSCPKRLSDSA